MEPKQGMGKNWRDLCSFLCNRRGFFLFFFPSCVSLRLKLSLKESMLLESWMWVWVWVELLTFSWQEFLSLLVLCAERGERAALQAVVCSRQLMAQRLWGRFWMMLDLERGGDGDRKACWGSLRPGTGSTRTVGHPERGHPAMSSFQLRMASPVFMNLV